MNVRFFCCQLIVALALSATIQAADMSDFTRGNERYAAGDYAGAAKAYERQVQRGEFSANLFYNLGDAYHRLNDRGRAILNYRRALLLEPAHAEAAANLAFIGGTKDSTVREGYRTYWADTARASAVFGLLGATALLIGVAGRRHRTTFYGVAVGFLLLCAAGGGGVWIFEGAGDADRAVVVTDAARALYSPVDSARLVTTLPAGGEVRVLSEQGAWWYVLLSDGTTRAWVAASQAERLVPKSGGS